MRIDHSLLLTAMLATTLESSAATLTNFAGTGEAGASGDRGPALQARLNEPFGIVRGPDGAMWFADYEAHVVRRIDPDGTITTVVGNGTGPYGGDRGPALGASLKNPHELRFDRAGSLFICDTGNHVIRRYDLQSKILTTFSGTGRPGYSGDHGPASKAELSDPISLQFSPAGDLYVADIGNHVIRRVDGRTGVITTFAGTGKAGPTPDGSPIRGTPLNGPRSLDFDAAGNLWLVTREGNQVLRFDLEKGVIRHVAGTGKRGFTGNGGLAKEATLNGPKGIAIAPNGDVYLADTDNNAIRRIDVQRGMMHLVAGTGEPGDGLPHGVGVPRSSTYSAHLNADTPWPASIWYRCFHVGLRFGRSLFGVDRRLRPRCEAEPQMDPGISACIALIRFRQRSQCRETNVAHVRKSVNCRRTRPAMSVLLERLTPAGEQRPGPCAKTTGVARCWCRQRLAWSQRCCSSRIEGAGQQCAEWPT